jgi:four helix bundle protein
MTARRRHSQVVASIGETTNRDRGLRTKGIDNCGLIEDRGLAGGGQRASKCAEGDWNGSSRSRVRAYHLDMSHFGPAVAYENANDPLFRMRAYRLAVDLLDVAWQDAKMLSAEPVTERIAGQLYAAVSSIGANLGEGYSRSSGKDRARIFEFALSSVRESITWYQAGRPVLGEIVRSRLNVLEELRRLLLAIIPRERGKGIPRTK